MRFWHECTCCASTPHYDMARSFSAITVVLYIGVYGIRMGVGNEINFFFFKLSH